MTIQEEIKKKLETYPNEFEDERNACEVGIVFGMNLVIRRLSEVFKDECPLEKYKEFMNEVKEMLSI